MRHVTFFVYILLLSSGFAGISFLIVLYKRLKEPVLRWVLIIISIFSLWLILTLLGYYLEYIILYPYPLDPYFSVINLLVGIAVYASVLVSLLSVYPGMSRLWLIPASLPLVLFYLFIVFWGLLDESIAAFFSPTADGIFLVSLLSTDIFLAFTGYVYVRGAAGASQDTVRFLLTWLGRVLMAFVGATLLITGIAVALGKLGRPTIHLNYLLFFIWNMIAIASFIRYVLRPKALIEEGEISVGFIKEYGISAREAEVIDLISHGLSNKEIASSMGISFTTARTHVYNIFKKTGARSRVELLRIVTGYRE